MSQPINESAEPLASRLRRRISKNSAVSASGCWEWRKSVDSDGYGRTDLSKGALRRTCQAHRVSYAVYRGPIPDGLTIDHLCRNRRCVNPDHLEAVSGRENTLRGDGPSAIHAKKTHCHNGHEFDAENTYVRNGRRNCRTCHRASVARYQALKREEPKS